MAAAVRAPPAERVQRYLLPDLQAMNFVLDDVLDGGVNDSLNLDSHGKALSFLLLDMPIDDSRRAGRLPRRPGIRHPLNQPRRQP